MCFTDDTTGIEFVKPYKFNIGEEFNYECGF